MGERLRWPDVWGATRSECVREYGCDSEVLAGSTPDAERRMVRAIDVDAPVEVLFRWISQLRVAPYSYDWIDNFGRRSPRQLREDDGDLAVGHRVMTIFSVTAVEANRQRTIRMRDGPGRLMFGDVAVSYHISPRGPGARLVAVVRLQGFRGVVGALLTPALAMGDALMMRKQLKTLAHLAEMTSAADRGSAVRHGRQPVRPAEERRPTSSAPEERSADRRPPG
jgi:hypothetical protein